MSSNESRIQAEVRRYLALDEEELFAEIGAARLGETLGLRPTDFGRFVRIGRLWFEEHAAELQKTVCLHPPVVALRDVVDRDGSLEAAAVVDALATFAGIVPVTAVAVIVSRQGLARFCGW